MSRSIVSFLVSRLIADKSVYCEIVSAPLQIKYVHHNWVKSSGRASLKEIFSIVTAV